MPLIRADQLREVKTASTALETLATAATASTRVAIAGVVMELRTDSTALCDAFAKRYRAHATVERADFTYYVVRTATRYLFWSSHSPVWEWSNGHLQTDGILFLTDAVALSALVRYDPTLVSIHGAGIRDGERTAAIVGNSTAGKTTTLLACARAGFQVYSDERVLSRNAVAYPFLRTCTVRSDGARRLLDDRGTDELGKWLSRRGASREELSIPDVFGPAAIAPPAPLHAVFVIGGYAVHARVEPMETANALPAITRWLDTRGDHVDRIGRGLRLVRGVACFRLVLGTPAATAQVMRETLLGLATH